MTQYQLTLDPTLPQRLFTSSDGQIARARSRSEVNMSQYSEWALVGHSPSGRFWPRTSRSYTCA